MINNVLNAAQKNKSFSSFYSGQTELKGVYLFILKAGLLWTENNMHLVLFILTKLFSSQGKKHH